MTNQPITTELIRYSLHQQTVDNLYDFLIKNMGNAYGLATLDENGKVPIDQIPDNIGSGGSGVPSVTSLGKSFESVDDGSGGFEGAWVDKKLPVVDGSGVQIEDQNGTPKPVLKGSLTENAGINLGNFDFSVSGGVGDSGKIELRAGEGGVPSLFQMDQDGILIRSFRDTGAINHSIDLPYVNDNLTIRNHTSGYKIVIGGNYTDDEIGETIDSGVFLVNENTGEYYKFAGTGTNHDESYAFLSDITKRFEKTNLNISGPTELQANTAPIIFANATGSNPGVGLPNTDTDAGFLVIFNVGTVNLGVGPIHPTATAANIPPDKYIIAYRDSVGGRWVATEPHPDLNDLSGKLDTGTFNTFLGSPPTYTDFQSLEAAVTALEGASNTGGTVFVPTTTYPAAADLFKTQSGQKRVHEIVDGDRLYTDPLPVPTGNLEPGTGIIVNTIGYDIINNLTSFAVDEDVVTSQGLSSTQTYELVIFARAGNKLSFAFNEIQITQAVGFTGVSMTPEFTEESAQGTRMSFALTGVTGSPGTHDYRVYRVPTNSSKTGAELVQSTTAITTPYVPAVGTHANGGVEHCYVQIDVKDDQGNDVITTESNIFSFSVYETLWWNWDTATDDGNGFLTDSTSGRTIDDVSWGATLTYTVNNNVALAGGRNTQRMQIASADSGAKTMFIEDSSGESELPPEQEVTIFSYLRRSVLEDVRWQEFNDDGFLENSTGSSFDDITGAGEGTNSMQGYRNNFLYRDSTPADTSDFYLNVTETANPVDIEICFLILLRPIT